MQAGISPAANGVFGRVLPRLESIAMVEIVGGLPVVEDLITVLDWGEDSSRKIGSCEETEGSG
jgi:hypothetical protein